jgi:hypothetical protein
MIPQDGVTRLARGTGLQNPLGFSTRLLGCNDPLRDEMTAIKDVRF